MKATAVLITKLKEYPQEVLDSLKKYNFDEILIETECPSIHRRYELALKAKNDLIYVQDDDCLVDVQKLYNLYNGQITNYMKQAHYNSYRGTGVTLVGWGTFFPKKMIDFSPYLDKYPIDALFLSQTDRVFTYLNQPHHTMVTDVVDLPTATDPSRMSSLSDHWDNLSQIRQRLLSIKK